MGVLTLPDTKILRLPQVLALLCLSRATFYKQIKDGVMPTGISLGYRSVAWLSSEVDTVITARICGYKEQELKELVKEIVNNRKSFMDEK